VLRFIEFWHGVTGHDPQWLYFDSKLASYPALAQVNERRIWFVTIRRRGAAILRRLRARPAADWHRAVIDIPKRRHKNIRYLDETVRLRGYPAPLRQLAVTGLGREEATLFLSNNFEASGRDLITRYAGRNGVEDSLGISVNFFHLDCLASEVRLNVDLDVALTVLAHGCYRWLAMRLRGDRKRSRNNSTAASWKPAGWWRSRRTASWCASTSGRTIPSCVRPRWTGTARASPGCGIGRPSLNTPNSAGVCRH